MPFVDKISISPHHKSVIELRAWLDAHPGSTVDEIAAAVLPGKVTGPGRVTLILGMLHGQRRVRRDGERWYPAG